MVKRACAWRYSTNGTNGGSTLQFAKDEFDKIREFFAVGN